MNVAQMESRDTQRLDEFSEALPNQTTLGLLKALCRQHDSLEVLIKVAKIELGDHDRLHPALKERSLVYRSALVNRITQAAIRQREILDQIIEVGGWLRLERAALEAPQ